MIRATRSLRDRYRQSWAGVKSAPSRGLLAVIVVAVVSMAVTVPWLIGRNADVARMQVAQNALEDQRRDCVRAVLSGADLQATALAGVAHAEDTAEVTQSSAAMWSLVAGILNSGNAAASPSVQEIVAAAEQYSADVDVYVANVAAFRAVAEQYHPRTRAECDEIGADVLEPLPPNPLTIPPSTTEG